MNMRRGPLTMVRSYGWEAVLALGMFLLYFHLATRYAGAFPSVFADEQVYSRFARLAPPDQAPVPSWLYFSAFRLTNACGAGFLDCARYLNLLFFVGAAPFIYGAARTVAPKPLALLAALAGVATPSNIYAAYFMPESMYFFGFAVLTWVSLARTSLPWYAYAAATGSVLALMALVKVHALFLLPAMALFALFVAWRGAKQRRLATGFAAALACISTAVVVKLGAGYMLVGPTGLGLFGSLYGDVLSITTSGPLSAAIGFALINLKGNLLALTMLYAVPLAVLLHYAASAQVRADGGPAMQGLVLFTVLMLGTAMALSVAYTSATAVFVPGEHLRLHARYYNFALMLLAIVAAARLHAAHGGRALPAMIGAALAAVIVYAASAVPSGYRILLVDIPELSGLGLGQANTLATVILTAQVALLGLWVLERRYAGTVFLAVVAPLIALSAYLTTEEEVARTREPGPSDQVGQIARDFLGAERGDVTIMGDSLGEMMRIQFQLDSADVELATLPPGWPIEKYALPGRKGWLLLTNEHALPAGVEPALVHPFFRLVRTGANNRTLGGIDMRLPAPNALLRATEGFRGPEPWGRRTNADLARLHFNAPLPRRLNLFLTAYAASAEEEGKEVVVRVGAREARIRLPLEPLEVCLPFDTDGTERTVTIEGAPGVGLVRVEIGERR